MVWMTGVMTMSEGRVRYFQGRKSGHVSRAADENVGLIYSGNPALTEVQVVPLDAIVIRRDELPGLDVDRHGTVRVDGLIESFSPHYKPDEARARGIAWIALSEYLREHPPVDEAQVKALNDIYEDWSQPHNYGVSFGQYLVERGVRVEARPNEQG